MAVLGRVATQTILAPEPTAEDREYPASNRAAVFEREDPVLTMACIRVANLAGHKNPFQPTELFLYSCQQCLIYTAPLNMQPAEEAKRRAHALHTDSCESTGGVLGLMFLRLGRYFGCHRMREHAPGRPAVLPKQLTFVSANRSSNQTSTNTAMKSTTLKFWTP
eukprot:CAMPEP_0172745258 /NCGR_PEP_ID=MMETSP1074-20121228/137458_1 /TAXON_ID=2916 /ORGANISM="Ceratium fusus, Strain PA161109" /LENGTH=163 /DNA_ID=CAMNT_0013576381 /DNA_START=120 /DNA_END=610 /DNA_ORIENTATION=-